MGNLGCCNPKAPQEHLEVHIDLEEAKEGGQYGSVSPEKPGPGLTELTQLTQLTQPTPYKFGDPGQDAFALFRSAKDSQDVNTMIWLLSSTAPLDGISLPAVKKLYARSC